MTPSLLLSLTAVSVVASALVAGVFLSFSDFVMRSLNKTDRPGGIEAMQIINREVFRTFFMVLLIGMSALSVVLIWLAWPTSAGMSRSLIIAGSATYILGVFAVTLLGNVPMNIRLDRLDHRKAVTNAYWADAFYPRWTLWNHVRTFAAIAASVSFLLACIWPSSA
jgi:uncharacterized membrane protein